MRFLAFLFACLLSLQQLQAQAPVAADSVTTVRYLMVHNWAKKMAAIDYISKQTRERMAYIWGSRSEWKVYTTLQYNASESRYEDSEERAEPEDDGFSWRKEAYVIRRNFDNGTTHDVIQMLGKTYILEDSTHAQRWKVKNDLKEVAGHLCMNASWEDTIKQQKIDVWFALDIPVPGGPERLCGLPGLILEADFNNGALTLTADKFTVAPRSNQFDWPKKQKGKKIKEADFQQVIKEHMAEKRKAEEPWFWGVRY
jgi:GLPGLI family protein